MDYLTPQIFEKLAARGWKITCAESCTGGLIGWALTEPAGASNFFERGFITYSNAAKQQMLGVRADTLASHGAVSEEVAAEMAAGALRNSGAGLAVSVTGIAGPGGSEHKPEGRVCFAIAQPFGLTAQTIEFGALGRHEVRAASTDHALQLLLEALRG